MTPTWFAEACGNVSVDELWAEVMFRCFKDFTFNQPAQPWSPDTCCMGTFNPAFDQQPGIEESRRNWLETQTPGTQRLILARLEERGIGSPGGKQ